MRSIIKISLVISFFLIVNDIYSQCVPVYTGGCTINQIDYFELEEIINEPFEPCESLNGNAWSQYLELGPATLFKGCTHSFTFSCGDAGGENVSVWIDFKDDLVLSADERVSKNFF